jgi:hypothetical protein
MVDHPRTPPQSVISNRLSATHHRQSLILPSFCTVAHYSLFKDGVNQIGTILGWYGKVQVGKSQEDYSLPYEWGYLRNRTESPKLPTGKGEKLMREITIKWDAPRSIKQVRTLKGKDE